VTEVRWTEQAADDLASIRDFIGRDSAAYALATVERLFLAVDQLRTFPDSGRVVPERDEPGLRELIRSPYTIVYRRRANVVEVLTVFHATRAFPETLG
jgi:plasmid stabilization system protein ParE